MRLWIWLLSTKLPLRAQAVLQRHGHWLPTMASGKLDTPHFRALLTPDLLKLESVFRNNGYSFRLVGGVVRDLLLGKNPKDVDIATECTPDEMVKLMARHNYRYVPTGLDHGTLTVHIGSTNYEITTLRVDRLTDGRHAVVDFTDDWRLDALRRDLTINSMSLGFDGTLYDYFDGQKHLLEKRVVFVGDARTRIREDYLRILRYFRFYGRIVPEAGRHDKETLEAIQDTAEGLRAIAVERVWMEMAKILTGQHCPHLVKVMYDLGVARNIGLPPDGNLDELDMVWRRSHLQDAALQPVSLLVTLIHTVDEAYDLAHHWKLSNNEKRLGVFVVEHRKKAYSSDTDLKYYQDFLVDGIPLSSVLELLHYCGHREVAKELREWRVPRFPMSGRDLKEVGLREGRELGLTLKALRQRWKDSYFTLSTEELVAVAIRDRLALDQAAAS